MLVLIAFILVSFLLDLGANALTDRHSFIRKLVVGCNLTVYGVISGLLCLRISGYGLWAAVLFGYRAFNMIRLAKGRMRPEYLHSVTFRTSIWLTALQVVATALGFLLYGHAPWRALLVAALLVQMVFAAVLLATTWGHARLMREAAEIELVSSSKLPSVTVAIPARNETSDLYECIQSLLASQYEKLEIIVLDDCSQTRRTPEIIRGFAHEGVRFIGGEEPDASWLAKNQAYERLAQAANGEYIIFAGVDIRFDQVSVRRLVSYAVSRHKSMVCVMPRNVLPRHQVPIIQPMRYVWEMAMPRKLVNKPPVLSSCWLIEKQALRKIGGFKAAARMVVPEAHLARELSATNEYSFVASGTTFGITSVKSLSEQHDTAIRVGYPSTHRRPEAVALLTLGYVAWVAIPLLAIIYATIRSAVGAPLIMVIMLLTLQGTLYAVIFQLAYGKSPILSVLSLPMAALMYVGLLNYSMYKYEFSEVTWKGRNVCLPVMRVIPHLPQT